MKVFWVYMMSNKRRTTFYIGVTNNLERRVLEHKTGIKNGFTQKYKCKELVYYESYNSACTAINREKQLKNWKRQWKIDLIQEINPLIDDLSVNVINYEIPDQARDDG